MSMEDEEYEQTLLAIKECFVYKIPPRHTSSGYKAADWNVSSFIWSGKLVITSKGEKCFIKLISPDKGDIFAICPYSPTSVEPVSDSSRYFVLKIDDGSGRHAFVGMGFTERSEAFDFNAALQDHSRYVKQKKEGELASKRLESQPPLNLSLNQNEKIVVNIKTKAKSSPSTSNTGPLQGGLLPPPPSATHAIRKPSNVDQNAPNSLWSDFTDFSSGVSSTPTTPGSNQNQDWIIFQ